jgi:SSS family solute:Na+ symporter
LLAVFAVIITLGGMKVIGYTDVIQVFVLVLGGLLPLT